MDKIKGFVTQTDTSPPNNRKEDDSSHGKFSKRVPQLDFLRGMAIIFVIGYHTNVGVAQPNSWESIIFHPLIYIGWSGVDLFFVLSGFLVSGLIFAEFKTTGGFHPGRFLVRRAFKIWPGYYIFLLITLPILATLGVPMKPLNVLGEVLFLQSYTVPTFWVHTWSLAIEEHFYLVLALLLLAMIKQAKSVKAIPYVCIATMIFALSCRLLAAHPVVLNNIRPTHLRADSLAFGVLLGYIYAYYPAQLKIFAKPRLTALIGIFLVLGGVALQPELNWFGYTWGLTLVYLGFGLIMVHLLHSAWPNNLALKTVSTIGIYSYSIYLWQPPAAYTAVTARLLLEQLSIHVPMFVQASIYVYLTIFLGIAMAKLIEFPLLRLRERVFPSASHTPLKAMRN